MESLYILIPVAIALAALAIKIFFWAVDHDQFEDLDSAAHSILFDDDRDEKPRTTSNDKDH